MHTHTFIRMRIYVWLKDSRRCTALDNVTAMGGGEDWESKGSPWLKAVPIEGKGKLGKGGKGYDQGYYIHTGSSTYGKGKGKTWRRVVVEGK